MVSFLSSSELVLECIKGVGFLVALLGKNLPAMQKTQVRSLDWEDPLEKGMAIHSSTLAWRIPRTEEPGGLQARGSPRVGATED